MSGTNHFIKLMLVSLVGVFILVACDVADDDGEEVAAQPTDTLQPMFSLTPRLTATPFFTRTPLPTFTPIPSDTPIPPTPTATSTPTEPPPITGIIQSLQEVNVRTGPGVDFDIIRPLTPGTGIEILGQNLEGNWYNILMEDGTEGWVFADLVFLESTPTPLPSPTSTPDLTAIAQGTVFPTALIGGASITPTPPGAIGSLTPESAETTEEAEASEGTAEVLAPTETESFIPVVETMQTAPAFLTATALAQAVNPIVSPPASATVVAVAPTTPAPTTDNTTTDEDGNTVRVVTLTFTPIGATADPEATTDLALPLETATLSGSPSSSTTDFTRTPGPTITPSGDARVQTGVDIFALCDDTSQGIPAPSGLAAGSTGEVFWAWFAAEEELIELHEETVTYEIRINGRLLSNWRNFGSEIQSTGTGVVKYWYVPVTLSEPGQYEITYRATWSEFISDGFTNFGPGSRNPVEEGSCTFAVSG